MPTLRHHAPTRQSAPLFRDSRLPDLPECYQDEHLISRQGEIQTYLYEQLPIPPANSSEQDAIIEIVDQILNKKKSNSNADTSDMEREIDRLVYRLYNLNEEEIKVIEK